MMPEVVWEASGHLQNFVDPLRQCLGECKKRWRADKVLGEKCPECGGPLDDARMFNLMFKTHVGPLEDRASEVYLRPETAQGMFVDFKNVISSSRVRVPFGIAQQGKAFRNEITPGNFVFRVREFELMEMEYFVRPRQDDEAFDYWRKERMRWYTDVLGINRDRLRMYDHPKESLSHYSKQTTDIEYEFPFGWGELEGIADRTDYDLAVHQERSNGEQRATGPPAPAPERGAGAGGGGAPIEEAGADRCGTRGCQVAAGAVPGGIRPDGGEYRPALPTPGRDRHPVLHHSRLRHADG